MTYVRGRLAVLREKLKRLPRMLAILVVSVIVSAIGALIANAFGADRVAILAGAPALFFTGWAFVGHLITIDDDMPDEWSNPEGDQGIWQRSLLELLLKAIIFMVALLFVFA